VLDEIVVEYPIGHKRRREEGIPKLIEKFKINVARIFEGAQQEQILKIGLDYDALASMKVNEFVDLMVKAS
jgi:2-methylcitrate dehydratase